MRLLASFFLLVFLAFGQTFQIKDPFDRPILSVTSRDGEQLFGYSSELGVVDFHALLTNISAEPISRVSIHVTVHKQDGTVVTFTPDCEYDPCDFLTGTTRKMHFRFGKLAPFTKSDADSVEFSFGQAWHLTKVDVTQFSGLISKDEDCFRDYIGILGGGSKGIVARKKVAELVQFGCAVVIDMPQRVTLTNKETFRIGPKRIVGIEVRLDPNEGQDSISEYSSFPFHTGWALPYDIRSATAFQVSSIEKGK